MGDLIGLDNLKFHDRQNLLDFDAALRGQRVRALVQGEKEVAITVALVHDGENEDPAALPAAVMVPVQITIDPIAVDTLRQAGLACRRRIGDGFQGGFPVEGILVAEGV